MITRTIQTLAAAMAGAALTAATVAAWATSRMGEAEVRQENGVPCFAVTPQEERRAETIRLTALNVYDISAKPPTAMWSFTLPAGQAHPISSKTCIHYDRAPFGASSARATPLQVGKLYEVFVNARPSRTTDPTFGYSARFCLLAQPGGGVKVHHVVYQDGWRDEACRGT